ncbi:MAG: hypothetical protein NDJ75_06450, partial [Thermoanaerobaculia bacterium]|nr:hypothetical protein [Thermoanaerobaculia bacterium]
MTLARFRPQHQMASKNFQSPSADVVPQHRFDGEPLMNRKLLWSLAAAFGLALALLPAVAGAQAIGTCTVGNTCSIETRLPG